MGAAADAGVSVPALHRAVRNLERLCQAPLVERSGRSTVLTRAGQTLARGFALGVAELTTAIEEAAGGGGRLAIGAMALSRSLLLPATLADLLREVPEAQVDVVEGSYLELAELLRAGRIDMLIGALRDAGARPDAGGAVHRPADHHRPRRTSARAGRGEVFWQPSLDRRAARLGLLDRWQQMLRPRRQAAPAHRSSADRLR
ncbi:LysR family transcriptional regulator [Sphingomonas sp. MMS24-JH45]